MFVYGFKEGVEAQGFTLCHNYVVPNLSICDVRARGLCERDGTRESLDFGPVGGPKLVFYRARRHESFSFEKCADALRGGCDVRSAGPA